MMFYGCGNGGRVHYPNYSVKQVGLLFFLPSTNAAFQTIRHGIQTILPNTWTKKSTSRTISCTT